MTWSLSHAPRLDDRHALVTGANSGLGLEVTRALAGLGARVTLACRDLEKAEEAARRVVQEVPGARVEVRRLDLADLDSVAGLAAALGEEPGARLDLLVNNAGLMAIDEARTREGVEMQHAVNHLGHFALTAHLLPLLRRTPGARIASMSSMGHRAARGEADPTLTRPYDRWQAYFHSKLANLLFTAELHRRLELADADVLAVAAHPGGSNTDLGTEGSGLTNRLTRLAVPLVTQSARAGARPMLRALTDPALAGGSLVGPRFVVRGARPVIERPSRRARDAEAARRLWDDSIRLGGVDPMLAG